MDMKKVTGEKGLLSLEACIAVTIFIFLMLFLYSFFVVFEARNRVAHAVLATANSMALDAYENETLGASGTISQILFSVYGQSADEVNGFTSYRAWYNNATFQDDSGQTVLSEEFSEVIKERFLAYLAGDANSAAEVLELCHIKDGADGLDFSGSHVSDDNLYLSVKYQIEYEFQVFGLGALEMEQQACSRIWTSKGS